MKSIVNRVVVLLAVVALTSVLALAKSTEKQVTFTEAVNVNGTLIKKGTYKVTLNEETGELTIKKGEEVLATAQARLEKTNEPYNFYVSSESPDRKQPRTLVSISWKDGNLATLVKDSNTAASSRP